MGVEMEIYERDKSINRSNLKLNREYTPKKAGLCEPRKWNKKYNKSKLTKSMSIRSFLFLLSIYICLSQQEAAHLLAWANHSCTA